MQHDCQHCGQCWCGWWATEAPESSIIQIWKSKNHISGCCYLTYLQSGSMQVSIKAPWWWNSCMWRGIRPANTLSPHSSHWNCGCIDKILDKIRPLSWCLSFFVPWACQGEASQQTYCMMKINKRQSKIKPCELWPTHTQKHMNTERYSLSHIYGRNSFYPFNDLHTQEQLCQSFRPPPCPSWDLTCERKLLPASDSVARIGQGM